jgi:hypothetical protein
MLLKGYEGPKEQWHAELERVNKHALLSAIEFLVLHLDVITGGMDRDLLRALVRRSKQYGKWDAVDKRNARFLENPDKFIHERVQRSRAAKKAARRRKKAR